MTFKEFEDNIFNDIVPNRGLSIRPGQAVMNYLGTVWFEEYKRLSNVDSPLKSLDCFYNDRMIPKTLNHLEKEWVNYPN